MRRTESGVGVYDNHAIDLTKSLREHGATVTYEDPPETRRFLSQNSAGVAVATIVLGIASAAAYDILKTSLRALASSVVMRLRLVDRVSGLTQELQGTPLQIASTESLWEPSSDSETDELVAPLVGDGPIEPQLDSTRLSHVPEIQARLLDAETALGRAQELELTDAVAAESYARQALASFASALNWAEDGAFEHAVHARMDAAGKWVSLSFGCTLHFEDGAYSRRCPVELGHTRIGMSVGGLAAKTCSICGEDLSECVHVPGRDYRVRGGVGPLDWCRVCLAREACEHLPDETYRARLVSIIHDLQGEEVSLVARPAMPDARMTSIGVEESELRGKLGPRFKPGMPVACVRCRGECRGFSHLKDPLPGE
jgi:hypothetical protein